MNWDENTHKTKGADREAFYDHCLNEFKKYYAYPKGYDEGVGDRAVKEFVKRNWKSLPYQEKDRAETGQRGMRHLRIKSNQNILDLILGLITLANAHGIVLMNIGNLTYLKTGQSMLRKLERS